MVLEVQQSEYGADAIQVFGRLDVEGHHLTIDSVLLSKADYPSTWKHESGIRVSGWRTGEVYECGAQEFSGNNWLVGRIGKLVKHPQIPKPFSPKVNKRPQLRLVRSFLSKVQAYYNLLDIGVSDGVPTTRSGGYHEPPAPKAAQGKKVCPVCKCKQEDEKLCLSCQEKAAVE